MKYELMNGGVERWMNGRRVHPDVCYFWKACFLSVGERHGRTTISRFSC